MMPMVQEKLETFDSASYNAFTDYFQNYATERSHVKFINLNADKRNCEANLFSDPLHLNDFGQKRATKTLLEELKKK
jgi:hypothetical protein